MITLCIVNVKLKRVDIVRMENVDALNYVRRLYFIPPQVRFVRIGAYKCSDSYAEQCYSHDIDKYISKMMPTHEELSEWTSYPLYTHRRK